MHDPMTVAWEIKWPIPRKSWGNQWRFPTAITIWHVDPEKDGTDDSCDWGNRKCEPPEKVEAELRSMAQWEQRYPFYFKLLEAGPGDAAVLLWAFWWTITHRVNYRNPLWRRILFKHERRVLPHSAFMEAVKLCANETDNIMSSFRQDPATFMCHEYPPDNINDHHHTSKPGVSEEVAYQHFRFFWRLLAKEQRAWWRHPRYHVWHWKIQIHSVQAFKRWAFSRCCKCGKGFAWGESPCTNSWHGDGPSWFRGEANVYHSDCSNISAAGGEKQA